MRRGVQVVGGTACGVSVEALGEVFFAAAFGAAGLWCSLGALWFEALGMWSVVCFLGECGVCPLGIGEWDWRRWA